MKKGIFIIAICTSTMVFGQQEPEVIAKYKDTARIGNFITRWYFDILGTSLVWKQSLTLYSDSTYRYVYFAKECGTFNQDTKGKWKKNGHLLFLDNELIYQVVDEKLYWSDAPLDKKNIVMK